MESTGAKLKNLRLQKGLTLEEVHKKTKIHLNILRAIEEDSFIGLNPVYIKGFLKIYCKCLGVDPKDYIKNYQEPQPQTTVRVSSDVEEELPPLVKTPSLKLSSFKPVIKFKFVFLIIPVVFFLIGVFILGKFISSHRKIQTKRVESTKLQKAQPAKVVTIPKEQTPATAPKKEILTIIRLGMRAKEDCWVDLKVDGRVVFHTVLKKGKSENWQAKEKIELSLGNAGAIELELNGKPLPPLGRIGQPLKNVLITKDKGLEVLR